MAKISTDKKKSLHGVVLIMVVTVMFVLIIMLLATLSVVSTAQNRYYTKYEENQAYYTARSALDVFTNNLLNDKDYYAYDTSGVKPYIHDNYTSGHVVLVKCYSGMANAACEVFDALQWKNVVGTLSGDDTFLIVARSERDAKTICTELTRHIG